MPPPIDPCDRLEARIEQRLNAIEGRLGSVGEALATLAENMRHTSKVEGRVDKLATDLDAAHQIIRQNKMVIDAIKWAVMLIVPATFSVFVAFAVEIIR
jgi:hypothetical protein